MFVGNRTQFLQYLEGNAGWAMERRKNLLAQMEAAEERQRRDRLNRRWDVKIAPQEEYERAERILTETLRSYVDDWLDSGRAPNGQERPLTRTLHPKGTDGSLTYTGAYWAVRRYLADNPMTASVFEGDKIGAAFAPDLVPVLGHDDPELQARMEAVRLFVHFMDSDSRWQLAKCYVCHTYFYPNRKRELYQQGAYCINCRGKVSMRKTNSSRDEWRKRILSLAAEFWPRWREKDGPRYRWIAMQVNGKLSPGEKRITQRWITENDEKIEDKARELQNAKG